jgi:hypothetical protein
MAALANAKAQEQAAQERTLTAAVFQRLGMPAPKGDKSEWPTWKSWADQRAITAFPALPAAIAVYILNNASLGERVAKLSRPFRRFTRARGSPSPDEADAVALCFSEPMGSPIPRSMATNFNRKIVYPESGYA